MVGERLRAMRTDSVRWAGETKTMADVAAYLRARGHTLDEGAVSRAERGKRGIEVGELADWLDFLQATPGERAAVLTSDAAPTEAA